MSINKRKMILWGITLLTGLMLMGCAGDYGYREYPYYDNNPHPSYTCPGDYGQQYCAR